MPMVLLVIDRDAMAKVEHAALVQDVKFDTLLSQEFNEFLVSRQYAPKPVVPYATGTARAINGSGAAQSVDSRDDVLAKIISAASQIKGKFVFSDVVALVPELAEMPKQETTTFASLFARKFHENDSGIVKVGKNSSKTTEYEVQTQGA